MVEFLIEDVYNYTIQTPEACVDNTDVKQIHWNIHAK